MSQIGSETYRRHGIGLSAAGTLCSIFTTITVFSYESLSLGDSILWLPYGLSGFAVILGIIYLLVSEIVPNKKSSEIKADTSGLDSEEGADTQ